MSFQALPPEQLLGPLNEVEQQHAPKTLYFAGDAGILEQGGRVSIVGARKASQEGIRRASRLAALLADRGIVVVSGLAEGVDTAAHEAAMKHRGRTIAVLGTPLDQVYPKKNAALQHRIMKEHLVISQYPPATRSNRRTFRFETARWPSCPMPPSSSRRATRAARYTRDGRPFGLDGISSSRKQLSTTQTSPGPRR